MNGQVQVHPPSPPHTIEPPLKVDNEEQAANNPQHPIQPPAPGRVPIVWQTEDIELAENEQIRIPISFLAKSFTISSYSGMWIHLRSLDLFIPPYTIGKVHNFPAGTNLLDIRQALPTPRGAAIVNGNTTTALITITAWSKIQIPVSGTRGVA